MKSLSGLDGLFLHLETPATPMHVGSVSLLERPPDHRGSFCTTVRHLYARRLPRAPVLSRTLATLPLQLWNPMWVQADEVDLEYHIQGVVLPRPGTQAQLEECVGQLHSIALDRTRPLWRVYIIEGLKSGQVAYYTKLHHALLDGQAAVILSQLLFDPAPKGRRFPRDAASHVTHGEHPGVGTLASAALKHDVAQYLKFMRGLPDIVSTLTGLRSGAGGEASVASAGTSGFAPRTPLNAVITGERGFAGVSIPLDQIKAIAAAHDAKINDVVLATCSGALRRYLKHHGGLPGEPLIAAVPISLREPGNTEYTTQATMARVSLASDIASPVRRLRAIRDAASAAKSTTGRAKAILPTDFPSFGLPWMLHGLASIYGQAKVAELIPPLANLVISNVAGPRVPVYFAGARVLRHWPLSIVAHGLGVNVTVESYAGAMGFGITAASNLVPDPRRIAEDLVAAHEELRPRRTGR
ncbi:MAG TPA: wax ester/triacylglycerol synthase family O-acyltransferase [Steroidobacteraceae bacterium]